MANEKINIGLTDAQRKGSTEILNGLLADESVLYTKLRNFHWNVVGMEFEELHEIFEEQYNQVSSIVDEIAERVRQLGETPIATMKEFLATSRLKEATGQHTPQQMLTALRDDHEALIRQMRTDLEKAKDEFNDAGNQDEITGWMKQHEKAAWMLRSMLLKG